MNAKNNEMLPIMSPAVPNSCKIGNARNASQLQQFQNEYLKDNLFFFKVYDFPDKP